MTKPPQIAKDGGQPDGSHQGLPKQASEELVRALEDWYSREARDLPWRRSKDPYGIWISEAMLQQTRVEAVREYWVRFLGRFPNVDSLAEAEEQSVLEAWSGLGYYRRARSLQAAARVLVAEHGGRFPRDRQEALALPGVGRYTAGAVLSIAYDLPEALVDGNVERVFARWFAIEEQAASSALKARSWELAEGFIPLAKSPGQWNQALMELGATVCTARAPRCLLCPVQEHCDAQASGDPARLPLPKPKRVPTPVKVLMAWVEEDGKVLMEQRPEGGRMAGLWQFPTAEVCEDGPSKGLFSLDWVAELDLDWKETWGEMRHSITRYAVTATLERRQLMQEPEGEEAQRLRWVPREEIAAMALTGLTKKALAIGRVRSLGGGRPRRKKRSKRG